MMSVATVSKAPREMLKGTGGCCPWQYFLNLVRETQINQATRIKGSVDEETGIQLIGREVSGGKQALILCAWGRGTLCFHPITSRMSTILKLYLDKRRRYIKLDHALKKLNTLQCHLFKIYIC